MRLVQTRGIQLRLVAKMVIDRRDVYPRAFGDLPNGGDVKSELGKNLPGRLDQTLARIGLDGREGNGGVR